MKSKDKQLINRFIDGVRQIPDLECILLYGSFARGEEDNRSDIDLMLVFDSEKPKRHISEVMKVVSELKPHREIRPVLTNLHDYDPSFFLNVFREGKLLWGRVMISGEGLLLRPFILISYDLTSVSPAKKVKISRFVHGYRSTKVIEGAKKTYNYTGVAEKFGVRIISKGTLLVPEQNKKEILGFLDNNGIDYDQLSIWLHQTH